MQTIRVMIVDDDDLVLQDLKTLVNWEVLGFQIVAEAHNGKKALELLKKSKPDLIICDIAMPVMDGLDFIDTLYQSKASVYTVIISAYENFQYAKRAMQNGISDYILKNELSGELLTQKLEQVKLYLSETKHSYEEMLRIALYKYFIFEDSDEKYLNENFMLQNMDGMLASKYHFFYFLLQKPIYTKKLYEKNLQKRDIKIEQYESLCKDISNRFQKYQAPILFYVDEIVIVGFDFQRENIYDSGFYRKIGKEILDKMAPFFQQEVIGFYYPQKMSISRFKKLFNGNKDFTNFLSTFNKDSFVNMEKYINEAIIKKPSGFNYALLKNYSEKYFVKLQEHLTELFVNKDIENIMKLFSEILFQFEELTDFEISFNEPIYIHDYIGLLNYIKETYALCVNMANENKNSKHSTIVTEIIEQIEQNYSDKNLTIDKIAEKVHMSSGRVSVLFKQDTGETINDFITKYRMQQAIWLLKNTNLKIYEIAERVGYQSAQYFSQVFSKNTTRCPIDYRK